MVARVPLVGRYLTSAPIIITSSNSRSSVNPSYGRQTIWNGPDLNFKDDTLHFVLSKYFPFYKGLHAHDQSTFMKRLRRFYRRKIFVVYQTDSYREMPILLSAAAIQLTFGLKEYLLPAFQYICVYPDAYVAANPLRILAGNVQGNSITLSWKHFFEDYQSCDNGVNVGLHEMAHALQMQYAFFYKKRGEDFHEGYAYLDTLDDHIRQLEQASQQRLFSDYALTNLDEFWASSIELFFEKPNALLQKYPELYGQLKVLLNQDPAVYPVVG